MTDLMPFTLTWAEVDPKEHAFDAADVVQLVRPLIPVGHRVLGRAKANRFAHDDAWEDAITQALVERFGRWACGWRWAGDEGSIGGGPVHLWCCPAHSLGTPDETAERVSAALGDWRGWLEQLATKFEQLAPDAQSDTRASFERATVQLVNLVVARTSAGDAWYNHCAQVLGWYLQRCGAPSEEAYGLVKAAIGGRFESWCEPPANVTAEIAVRVARGATERGGA
ncbi:MAG: hypothetical protein QM756_40525 [Polyangiaceae bacterium]